jgi:hypothetical protein
MGGESIKIKTGEAVTAFHAINNIFNMRVPMRAKEAYWLGRNQTEVERVYKDYNKRLIAILEEHGGIRDEATQGISLPPTVKKKDPDPLKVEEIDVPNPEIAVVQKLNNEMMEKEVEIEINKISLAGFMQAIVASDMKGIEFMIEHGEAEQSNLIRVPGGDFTKRLKQ